MSNINSEISFQVYEGDQPRVKEIKETAKLLASTIIEQTPAGPEQTLALRQVEVAVMWAVASVDRAPAYAKAAKDEAKQEKKKAA